MEKSGQISSIEKFDEYYRFCNILHRLIENNNLPESVQLIQYDDQIDERDADSKPPCDQMKQYIDQWYQTADNFISNPMVCDEIVLKKDFN